MQSPSIVYSLAFQGKSIIGAYCHPIVAFINQLDSLEQQIRMIVPVIPSPDLSINPRLRSFAEVCIADMSITEVSNPVTLAMYL